MTARSQWINPLFIPEEDGSEIYFVNLSEDPDGFEFISHGQHENTSSFCFSLFPSPVLYKPVPWNPILKILLAQSLHLRFCFTGNQPNKNRMFIHYYKLLKTNLMAV